MKLKVEVELDAEFIANLINGMEGTGDDLMLDWDDMQMPDNIRYVGDKMGYVLTHGGCVYITDLCADGEAYGSLLHWKFGNGSVRYTLRMKDFEQGIANIIEGKLNDSEDGDAALSLSALMCDYNSDCGDNYNVLQAIVFNEVVYG